MVCLGLPESNLERLHNAFGPVQFEPLLAALVSARATTKRAAALVGSGDAPATSPLPAVPNVHDNFDRVGSRDSCAAAPLPSVPNAHDNIGRERRHRLHPLPQKSTANAQRC